MGYIQQSGSAIADSPLVSASMWVRPPTGTSTYSLIDMVPSGFFQDWNINFDGSNNSLSFGSALTFLAPCTQWTTSGGSIAAGSWYHIALSCDVDHANTDPKITNCVINAVTQSTTVTDDPNSASDAKRSYSFLWNGSTIGIPDIGDNIASSPAIIYGDVQVWVGKYIDWTDSANFAKVVTLTGSAGKPTNPTVAASAFGAQTLLFRGNAAQFPVNGGTGGAFTKFGTATDFTPTPAYG